MSLKTYDELIKLPTYFERLCYLQTNSKIGEFTFGDERYLNQMLYRGNKRWSSVRREAIIRDQSCDIAIPGLEIVGSVYVHHINPLSPQDLEDMTEAVFDLNNLICLSFHTHNKVHFGLILEEPKLKERTEFDTCPWRLQ